MMVPLYSKRATCRIFAELCEKSFSWPGFSSLRLSTEHFQVLGMKRVTAGAVLYNGEQPFKVQGVRIFNPFHVEEIWET